MLKNLPPWYNLGYTLRMKTAISIPDPVFQRAEAAAKQMSLSRSELYTKAVQTFLDVHHCVNVTQRLNEVYAEQSSELDPALVELQRRSFTDESW